jgi:hypothetical protein
MVALVGFQGHGGTDGVQPDFCHALLLEALIFSIALKMSDASWTAKEHKTPESNKSVHGYRYLGDVGHRWLPTGEVFFAGGR